MRKLYRFKEAADKFYGGDEETLRHALLLGVVRARVEVCDRGEWAWWAEGDDPKGNPDAGRSEEAQWRPVTPPGTYELTGWFYLDQSRASKLAHGRLVSDLLLSVDEDEERFLGLTFRVGMLVDLNDLWFEPSENNGKFRQPEDEMLDHMADQVVSLTSDPQLIARYQAAAQAGGSGLDFDQIQALVDGFKRLESAALVGAAQQAVREQYRTERAKGGFAKHLNSKAALAKAAATALWPEADRKGWTAVQLHTRLAEQGHKVSAETVRKWLTSLRQTGSC